MEEAAGAVSKMEGMLFSVFNESGAGTELA
jgi:hypothetical protein